MAQFDPSEKDVDSVLKHLAGADKAERDRVLAAEAGPDGKRRKTVLEKYGIDADARYDATGRKLYPWEVTGKDMADAGQEPEESEEARKAREAQAELDAATATPQLGSSPAGSGVAPAAQGAGTGTVAPAGTTTTTARPSGGAPTGT